MNRNLWTQKECEKCVRHYVDETNRQDFDPSEIATWAQGRKYTMPEPMTGVEILAQLLRKAVNKARRRDPRTSIVYRAALVITEYVKGERKTTWFDSEGPSATADRIAQSVRQRKEQAINILVSAEATQDRYARTHPSQRFQKLDLSISGEEVQWRLFGKAADEQIG
jgi:hypothetical protein